MRIIWRWRANVIDYIGLLGVVGIGLNGWKKNDWILAGRDGWVAYLEESPNGK